jgi:Fe-S cluster assembly scaffold protein SufB
VRRPYHPYIETKNSSTVLEHGRPHPYPEDTLFYCMQRGLAEDAVALVATVSSDVQQRPWSSRWRRRRISISLKEAWADSIS